MTNNPLARRQAEHFGGSMSFNANQWAAERNATMNRQDIEWIVAADGNLKLVDRGSWTSRRTQELKDAAERDRQQFKHRMEYPIHREAAE